MKRRLLLALAALVAVAALAATWLYTRVRASLPQLDGAATVAGLGAPVTVERDALGVPTLRGRDRADVARGLGWLHAQERFFQMDLQRRAAAGELAELFGARALDRDRTIRLHGFRRIAQASVAALPAAQRTVLDAYVAGVNAGLAALGAKPWEYYVLRETPRPWLAEDSILVGLAIVIDLQDEDAGYERTLAAVRDVYELDGLAVFAPLVGPDDAALDGTVAPLPPIPGPKLINVRARKSAALPAPRARTPDTFPLVPRDPEFAYGSNALALAGRHTAAGGPGLLANDMHLRHGLPNIWYRASLVYGDRRVVGATLPGVPAVVVGSNGRVAWGFTAGLLDTGDVVVVETNSVAPNLYKVPGQDDFSRIESRKETIRVKGGDPVEAVYQWTVWGPIIGTNERNRPLAYRWVAHEPVAADLSILEFEGAQTVAETAAIARRAGLPGLNLLVADHRGDVAWTVGGRLPERSGFDGRLPVSWSFGDRRWRGLLPPEQTPVVTTKPTGSAAELASADGRLWSGNARQLGGEALALLGDGAYRRPARAAQLRDGLAALTRATPKDLLAVQLDDRALFLAPWRRILLDALTPAAVAGHPSRAAVRAQVETWDGHAGVDAVGQRLVREFRSAVHRRVFTPIFAPCVEAYPEFRLHDLRTEPALRAILKEQPLHLLAADYPDWSALLLAAVDEVVAKIEKSGATVATARWGDANRARIQHPLATAFPWLRRWLAAPADPLAGDHDMPRAQTPANGVSQRLVVAPGREDEGIFHMPGGQSGHPLSPYFLAGHTAWLRGEPTPLLPGPARHTLTLAP